MPLNYEPQNIGTKVQKNSSRCPGLMSQHLKYLALAEGSLFPDGFEQCNNECLQVWLPFVPERPTSRVPWKWTGESRGWSDQIFMWFWSLFVDSKHFVHEYNYHLNFWKYSRFGAFIHAISRRVFFFFKQRLDQNAHPFSQLLLLHVVLQSEIARLHQPKLYFFYNPDFQQSRCLPGSGWLQKKKKKKKERALLVWQNWAHKTKKKKKRCFISNDVLISPHHSTHLNSHTSADDKPSDQLDFLCSALEKTWLGTSAGTEAWTMWTIISSALQH